MTGTTLTRTARTSSTYHCAYCGHEPTDAPHGGALRHCEACGSWVTAPANVLGRDLDLPLLSPVPA